MHVGHRLGQLVEADGPVADEGLVVEMLGDDHVEPGEQEGAVGARTDAQPVGRLARHRRQPRVDGDDLGARAARRP